MKFIIAAFSDPGAANHAASQLGPDRDVGIISQDSTSVASTLRDLGVPENRSELYEEAVRRGAALVTARAKDDEAYELAVELDRMGALDLEDTVSTWREQELAGPGDTTAAATAGIAEQSAREGVPVIQEEVTVGKREVPREGVRVRTFVVERPVEETVQLREEHIEVSREPVDEPATTADTTFAEDEYVVTATGEEAVVGKQARVVERVHVEKTAETREEKIDETERRREVEITREPGTGDPTRRP